MTTTRKNETDTLDLILDGTSTDQLLEMLAMQEEAFKAHERGSDGWKANHTVWLWIADALEARYDVNAIMDAWADTDDDRTYTQALTDAVKAVR
jgi:hypothetical protein